MKIFGLKDGDNFSKSALSIQ